MLETDKLKELCVVIRSLTLIVVGSELNDALVCCPQTPAERVRETASCLANCLAKCLAPRSARAMTLPCTLIHYYTLPPLPIYLL